ncbi:hypothetical protein THRCLA_02763 [Thraustotheca clavata]|uniref:SWIM-type domain-containing protein n=1 Tax=Thraustotheca clavata TaxID=74557 RepID=A0A1W0A4U9_9STRA|nr:hypothetical protein THRCLA_02763 [Thraustotheca clavata]
MHHIIDTFRSRFREVSLGGPNDLVDLARNYMNDLRRDATYYTVDFIAKSGEATVRHFKVPKEDMVARSIVRVRQMSCSCGLWQDLLLPCVHALAIEPRYAVPIIYLKKAPRSLYGQNLSTMEEFLLSESQEKLTTAPRAPLQQRIDEQHYPQTTNNVMHQTSNLPAISIPSIQQRTITPTSSQSSNSNATTNKNMTKNSSEHNCVRRHDENTIDLTNTPNDSEMENSQSEPNSKSTHNPNGQEHEAE